MECMLMKNKSSKKYYIYLLLISLIFSLLASATDAIFECFKGTYHSTPSLTENEMKKLSYKDAQTLKEVRSKPIPWYHVILMEFIFNLTQLYFLKYLPVFMLFSLIYTRCYLHFWCSGHRGYS